MFALCLFTRAERKVTCALCVVCSLILTHVLALLGYTLMTPEEPMELLFPFYFFFAVIPASIGTATGLVIGLSFRHLAGCFRLSPG